MGWGGLPCGGGASTKDKDNDSGLNFTADGMVDGMIHYDPLMGKN
jgi:hypothetical protein